MLGLSEALPSLVAKKFANAKDSGALLFSATHLAIIHASGIPFQLRYCPALAKKPAPQRDQAARKHDRLKPDEDENEKQKENKKENKKFNPFESPSPELLIATIPAHAPTHNLVLNKFPVIPNHFILATKEFKPQTDLLEEADLAATYACLRAWEQEQEQEPEAGAMQSGPDRTGPHATVVSSQKEPKRRRLFAFFNSGEHSGASQPHRHLQFLPVEDMLGAGNDDDEKAWTPLINAVGEAPVQESSGCREHPGLPFCHFAIDIAEDVAPAVLYDQYLFLHQVASEVVKNTPISYNLAMTSSTMMLCPRRSEGARLALDEHALEETVDCGNINLNGTILAGTLMVKAKSEWEELKLNQQKLEAILETIGYPTSRKADGSHIKL